MSKLTVEALKDMRPGEVFAMGTVANSPDGVYMADSRKGDMLIWAAKRGGHHDWVIYTAWEEFGLSYAIINGQKVTTDAYIRKLVPCTDEALALYRK